jgi:hypothetical protein
MKKIILLIAVVAAFAACTPKTSTNVTTTNDTTAVDTVKVDTSLSK